MYSEVLGLTCSMWPPVGLQWLPPDFNLEDQVLLRYSLGESVPGAPSSLCVSGHRSIVPLDRKKSDCRHYLWVGLSQACNHGMEPKHPPCASHKDPLLE